MMVVINKTLSISMDQIEISAIRAQGPGGQNVNKVATAVQVRFNITASDLPDSCKARLLNSGDSRITKQGVVVIKAREFRSQDQNREAALERLKTLIRQALVVRKKRIPTTPGPGSRQKRLARKIKHSRLKRQRAGVTSETL